MLFESRQSIEENSWRTDLFIFYHRYWSFPCSTCQSNQVHLNSLLRSSINWEKKKHPRNLEMQCISKNFFSLLCTSLIIRRSPQWVAQKNILYQIISLKKKNSWSSTWHENCYINITFMRMNLQIRACITIIWIVSIITKLP